MAELRKMDYKAISVRCNEEGRDYIPSNWYIPARKAWQIVAWLLIQLRNEAKIRDDKTTDKMIHQYWAYIEDKAIAVGEEKEDGTEESNYS